MIAKHGVHTERRLELRQCSGPVVVSDGFGIAGELMTGNVVAEQQHGVGRQRIDLGDDALDALDVHPRLAGVQVGEDGEPDG